MGHRHILNHWRAKRVLKNPDLWMWRFVTLYHEYHVYERTERQNKALRELVALSEELGLYPWKNE